MLKYIDLFCGIGGFRIALDSLNNNCVFSSDWDKEAQKTYRNNFNETPESDITKINNYNIPHHDILCAGFPCQPFSISGKQKGFNDIRGTLFHDIVRIAEYHQPKYLILENVGNLVKHNNGVTLNTIITFLNKANYYVYYKILNGSDFGIPQARKRVYFIAIRKNVSSIPFTFPKPTYEPITLNDIIIDDKYTKNLVINRTDIHLNKNLLYEKSLFDIKHLKPIRVGYVNKGGQGERIYSANGHAITLSAYGGGIGAKTGLYYINNKIRKLHPEECKKIMSFPNNFKINSNPSQAYKQFGNSVIVKVIKKVVEKLLEDYEWQSAKKMQRLEIYR